MVVARRYDYGRQQQGDEEDYGGALGYSYGGYQAPCYHYGAREEEEEEEEESDDEDEDDDEDRVASKMSDTKLE